MEDEEVNLLFLRDVLEDYTLKIYYLIQKNNMWSEDGTFTFPDGDIWKRREK